MWEISNQQAPVLPLDGGRVRMMTPKQLGQQPTPAHHRLGHLIADCIANAPRLPAHVWTVRAPDRSVRRSTPRPLPYRALGGCCLHRRVNTTVARFALRHRLLAASLAVNVGSAYYSTYCLLGRFVHHHLTTTTGLRTRGFMQNITRLHQFIMTWHSAPRAAGLRPGKEVFHMRSLAPAETKRAPLATCAPSDVMDFPGVSPSQ